MPPRTASVHKKTGETDVTVTVSLDGTGRGDVASGIGFLDHMLMQLARHGHFDLTLRCKGDLHIDDHHTAEDCALAVGQAFEDALGDRSGIRRFGYAYAPLDEALVRVVVDLSGRPWAVVNLPLARANIGGIACENLQHFLQSFAIAARMNLHVDLVRGDNDHHKIEAAFKALALALRQAVSRDAAGEIPSTKGVLG